MFRGFKHLPDGGNIHVFSLCNFFHEFFLCDYQIIKPPIFLILEGLTDMPYPIFHKRKPDNYGRFFNGADKTIRRERLIFFK